MLDGTLTALYGSWDLSFALVHDTTAESYWGILIVARLTVYYNELRLRSAVEGNKRAPLV